MNRDNEVKLREAIICLSISTVWESARCEWKLEEIQIVEDSETCLCGHTPINELCFLRNKLNHTKAMVGNVCVHKFMGIPSHLIFQGIKRIMVDIYAALNSETTVYAYERGWLTKWDYGFCDDTRRKRNLTDRQLEIRRRINSKVLTRLGIKGQSLAMPRAIRG